MSDFAEAIKTVILTHEGGFQSRVDDPGNWTPGGELKGTKFGISAHSFPNEDIEGLTINRAEELYREVWGKFALIEDQRVLTKVLDLAVNTQWGGHGPATEILQRAVDDCGATVKVDESFGEETAAACNGIPADRLLAELCTHAAAYYAEVEARRPEMKAWFKTWEKRAVWMPPVTEPKPVAAEIAGDCA